MTLPLEWQLAVYAWLDALGVFLWEAWPSGSATPRVLWLILLLVLGTALVNTALWVVRNGWWADR